MAEGDLGNDHGGDVPRAAYCIYIPGNCLYVYVSVRPAWRLPSTLYSTAAQCALRYLSTHHCETAEDETHCNEDEEMKESP